ncbi:hypothetical protein B0H14DRAFT_2593462 [Mycena olivaceomarginata]|nr:hypothetical protein B0H14DRAFT_2593462 [Mycena olivaceomarginata]
MELQKGCWELPAKISGGSQVCELSSGAPITPTEGSWEHPLSSPGSIHGITERLLGASRYITWVVPSPLRNIVGGSQDYYKGGPMAVRRELPRTLENPECRSVKNPVEAGNVFCASVEGGYRGAVSQAEGETWWKGKKHSTPAEEGGNEQGGGRVKCIPHGRGGQEGSNKGAASQVGGYNVFHGTEGRHRGTVSQGKVKCVVQ